MNKRTASLLVLVVIAILASFVSLSQPAAAQANGKRTSVVPRQKAPTLPPPPSNIGFLSATQIAAEGGTYSPFPAVIGDFDGNGKLDVATIVNTNSNFKPMQAISVILSNGDGTFTNKLTPTTYTSPIFNPVWAGDLNGDGKDDIVVGIQAIASTTPASIDVYLSNGDGTFTLKGNTAVTTTSDIMVWGTLTKDAGTGFLDFVAVDAASPNGSIWTLTGKNDGTFNTATSVAFTGALAAGDPANANSFSPVVFADFDGANGLDFAGPVPTTNQIAVYLNNGSGYTGPTLLATQDGHFQSCYLGAGDLSGHLDLVAANCYNNNNVTVWVNNGAGSFGTGKYYPVSTLAGVVPSAVSIADIDGDGNNDVVSSNWQGADVTVLLGDGTGALSAPGLGYAIGGGAHINAALTPAVVSDFNGDGHADVILQDSEFSFVYLQSFGTTPPSFRSAVDYSVPVLDLSNSVGIANGDFNGDGIPDFVVGNGNVTNATTLGVTVFISNPDGTLQPGVSYAGSSSLTNPQFQYVAVADFDGDGKLDIAATDSVSGVVQIFAGDGAGHFTPDQTTFSAGTGVSALGIAAGDFNGDKKSDLAVVTNTNTPSANVAILTNSSTGPGNFGFILGPLQPLATLATEITVADLNKDGKLDLVVPLWGTAAVPGTSVAVFLGKGDGTFTGSNFDLGAGFNNPYYATIGDFDGDGNVDMAVTLEDQTTTGHLQGIGIALGKGDGTFKAPSFVYSTAQKIALDEPFPGYIKAVDLNRDGKLDLVYTNKKYGTVGILYGAGDGTFPYTPLEFAAGAKAYDIALADINGDGAVDVVTSSNARDFVGVTVLLNTSGDTTVLNPPSANNVSRGTPVTFTAVVTGSTVAGVTAVPTGTVSFIDNGSNVLGSGPLVGGQATLTTGSLETGANSVVAQYNGDKNYLVSTSSAQMVTVTGQTGSATTLASLPNPSTVGQSVTFTATVKSTLAGDTVIPSGPVKFMEGTTVLGSGALNSSGVATLAISTLTAGKHSIDAVYSGDTNFTGSTSTPPLSQVVNPTATPDYTLTASPTSATVNPGSSATFTIAVVAGVNGYTGAVTFDASSCTGLPADAGCSFSASPVQAGKTTTLTITTKGPTAVLKAPANVNHRQGGLNLWASLSGVGVLGMVLAGGGKKRNRRLGIVFTVLALVMLLALVGCGGGSSSGGGGGGGGGGGTPAGTSTIQLNVTGTINTTPHKLTTPITLTVN